MRCCCSSLKCRAILTGGLICSGVADTHNGMKQVSAPYQTLPRTQRCAVCAKCGFLGLKSLLDP